MNIDLIRKQLPDLDYDTGLAYCADDPEFFEELLGEYAEGRYDALCSSYDCKDWKTYEIEVHSLKSTSRTIGLTAFGDECEKMQKAAGIPDENYIQENHAALAQKYLHYLEVIREAE